MTKYFLTDEKIFDYVILAHGHRFFYRVSSSKRYETKEHPRIPPAAALCYNGCKKTRKAVLQRKGENHADALIFQSQICTDADSVLASKFAGYGKAWLLI